MRFCLCGYCVRYDRQLSFGDYIDARIADGSWFDDDDD